MSDTIIREKVRIPPQNVEAEMALLGSIMLRPEAIYEVIDFIDPKTCYADRHCIIYEAMLDLFQKHTPIDLLSLSTYLKENGNLDRVGGASYLAELVNSVPSSANVRHYAEIVQKKYMMRRLISASEYISHLGYEEAADLEETLDKAEKHMYDVTQSGIAHKFVHMKDELVEAWNRLERLQSNKGELRGIPTGFAEIDRKLAGLQKADLIILAARPSMGKTSLALDIARQAAVNHNVPVGIFSLEMASEQLVDRMVAAQAQVDAWKLRTGNLSLEQDFASLQTAMDVLSRAPIYIDDQPGNSILKMRSVARRLKSEKGLGLIVVDYLQLMVPPSSKASDNLVQQVTEISRSLKNLARELEVPVLALSQLSRAVENRDGNKPRLSDLRDSGSIEQDADVVMFIHRPDKYKDPSERTNVAEILIEKHRNGETGKVDLFFNEKKATFQNLEKSQFGGTEKEFESF